MSEEGVPQTMAEAVARLLAHLGPDGRAWLRTIAEDDLDEETWGLAAGIRMEYGLWEGTSPLVQSEDELVELHGPHTDDVSAEIIYQAWLEAPQPDATPRGGTER